MANQTKVDMTNTPAAAATIAHTAAAAPPPKSVPTISQSTHVDAGSALSSLFAVAEKYRPALEKLADSAEDFVFSKIPFGSLLEEIWGPHMAAQYMDQAINQAEALAAATGTKLGQQDVFSLALSTFKTVESWLPSSFEAKIEAWVKAAAAKVGISI